MGGGGRPTRARGHRQVPARLRGARDRGDRHRSPGQRRRTGAHRGDTHRVGRDGDDEDSVLGDFIEDEVIENPVDYTTRVVLREQLDEVLDTLTDREENVLRLRFGLDDGKMRTLEDVGKVFNVTRERIRQIEAKALRKLRHPSRSKPLRDFIED